MATDYIAAAKEFGGTAASQESQPFRVDVSGVHVSEDDTWLG